MTDAPLAGDKTYTYHCICTTLTISTVYDLDDVPVRKDTKDGALILPITFGENQQPLSRLHGVSTDAKATMIRRHDGFEKRTLFRCVRCNLIVGYHLDQAELSGSNTGVQDVYYILPGSFATTEQMKEGKKPRQPEWARTVAE